MKRFTRVIGILFGCLFLCLLIAIAAVLTFGEFSASASTSLKSGRSITAVTHTWRGVDVTENSNDTATIDTAGYSIVVTPKQLIVDGHVFATIDGNTKSVVVDVSRGEVAFKADGDLVGTLSR